MQKILGISAFYHDSAAALIVDGNIIAAAQEERFTRKKHDQSFPSNAVKYVLSQAGISVSDLDIIAFYDKPYIKFERLLESYHAFAPQGLKSFLSSMPVWIKEKLFMRRNICLSLEKIESAKLKKKPELLFPEHHLSHAASAFFPSPFDEAAIVTIDGVGEWATTTICHGRDNTITKLRELTFPHSIGLLYSAFTAYCGFKVNSGEYKLMGLAPYGRKTGDRKKRYKKLILHHLISLKTDGSLMLNMDFFDFATGLRMYNQKKWEELFELPPRRPESELSQDYMDLALGLQEITEEALIRIADTARKLTGSKNIVMAGGVALNCVANGHLVNSELFENLWIQPAAGDAGGALGAALAAHYIGNNAPISPKLNPKKNNNKTIYPSSKPNGPDKLASFNDSMQGSYLGPAFTTEQSKSLKYKYQAVFNEFNNFDYLCRETACLIAENKVVGWFQGRMEWGPRALGNRSILADPRNPETQKKLNLKIKYREGFRPFAPSVLAEDAKDYFDIEAPSPYMILVAPVLESIRTPEPEEYEDYELYRRLYHIRSTIPAVTHVDYSARIQTVHRETNHRYWKIISEFKQLTGIGLLVNTSFNVRGEPIVCTPEDAYRCFMRTQMDVLVIENLIFFKEDQPELKETDDWQIKFELD